MLLVVEGLEEIPERLMIHAFFENPGEGPGVDFQRCPPGLLPLGKSEWPQWVLDGIVKICREIGLSNPLRQKLVEPNAHAFGGWDEKREKYDLAGVDWDKLIDYFTWEAAAWTDVVKAEKLQKRAKKKYGGIFSHHEVYEPV
jgi:hypothetical protein